MSIPANDDKSALFRGVMCLAPMVRAGSLPFRVLCMKYGADLVFGEEIIDKRLVKCKRVENKELNTIDFVTTDNNCTLFRTAALERNRVIFQMGTADAQTALQAARIIADDVAGIDINMGCPKGGMGAALLKDPQRAAAIVHTLASNLPHKPISAKIRLLDTLDETIAFMRALEEAGAAAITVHLRSPRTPSSAPAQYEVLASLTTAVSIPVLANGDVYTRGDLQHLVSTTGISGAMLGRPALLNASLFRRHPTAADAINTLSIRQVIIDFLTECTLYAPQTVVVKYTIQEMMSLRRHSDSQLKRLASLGVDYGRLHPEFLQISEAKSVATMCDVFGVSYPNNATTIRPSFVINETTEHRFDNSYFKEDLEEASSVKTETESKNTTLGDKIEGDIQNDVSHIDKKVKVEHDR